MSSTNLTNLNSLTILLALFISLNFASAQQPTPYIPATHTGFNTPSPTSSSASTLTSPAPHFLPPLSPTFRLSNSKEEYAASIYLALTSVHSTWTARSEYPRITSAVYGTFPFSSSPLPLFPFLPPIPHPPLSPLPIFLPSHHLFPITFHEDILTTPKEAAPASLHPSLQSSGYNWPAIVTAPWYSSINASVRSQIGAQESALQNTFDSMVAQANAEAEKEAAVGATGNSGGIGRREMLGNGWALGMGMGMGFMVGVWLVGGF